MTLRVAIQAWLPQAAPSGAVHRLIGLLHGLAALPEARQVECCLLSGSAPLAPELAAAARAWPGCHVETLPIPDWPTWRRVRAEQAVLPAAIRRLGIDVVDFASLPMPRLPAPSVLTVHDLRDFGRFGRGWRCLAATAVLRQALARAAAIVVPSPPVAAELRQRFPGARCQVVPAGVTTAVAAVPSPWPRCFVHAGRDEPRKELPFLVESHRLARTIDPGLPPLVLIGTEVRSASPPAGVIEPGVVAAALLRGVFRQATAIAFPSSLEGFGLPVLEAMSEACPALVLEGGTPAWLAERAALALPRDAWAWAAAMARLANDASLRQTLSSRARSRARLFSPVAAARRMLQVWASVRSLAPYVSARSQR